MTDLSLLNPGTSLQLEGTGNQLEEETEYQQEEKEKEKELRELLTNAFDDFIEDDILSECSHDEDHNSSRHVKSTDVSQNESTPLQAPVPYSTSSAKTISSTPQIQSQAMFSIPKSTNQQHQQQQHYFTDSHYPPLLEDTPTGGAVHHWQHEPHSHMTAEAGEHYGEDELYGLPNAAAQREMDHWEQGQIHLHGYSTVTGRSAERHLHSNPVIGQREEAEGGNEQNHPAAEDADGHWYQHHMPNGYYIDGYDTLQQQHHEHDVYAAQAAGADEVQQQQQHGYYGETANSGEHFAPNPHSYIPSHDSHEQQNYLYSPDEHEQQAFIPSHDLGLEPYAQPQSHDAHEHQGYAPSQPYEVQPTSLEYQFHRADPPSATTYPLAVTLEKPLKSLEPLFENGYKVNFNQEADKAETGKLSGPFDRPNVATEATVDQDLSTDSQQVTQLKILYKARGRKMEELTAELDQYKQESAREIRILKHQLSMAQGDREGMETSLKQCQNLLQASQGEVTELRAKLQTAEAQIQALKQSKDELINKLSSAEANIEGLNEQVAELGKSDTLDRARVQHQSVVNGLQLKYDTEILSLKEKQDSLYELVADKEREIKSLRQQLAEVQHQAELAQISRAETINRLTKSLEESQRQCHSLLESSVNEELGKTKALLKQKTAAKEMTDEMCQALKEELVDLREQLSMFESASSLGVFSTISSSKSKELHDDSMTDLGIKKTLDFKTPESVSSTSAAANVPDDYVEKLKMELERCLMSNKTKRSQVARLQTELRAAKTELNDLSSRCERAEKSAEELKIKVKNYEDEFSPGEGDKISVVEKRLRKEIENLKIEKDGLLAETQDLKHRLEEVATSEEKVNEINRELSAEISQMIRDYDYDKKEGLDKCHEAYMHMVEDAKSRVRQEMTSAAESEKQALVEKYESELVIVRDELRGAWKEVDTAKELYIKLSEEKTQLEIQLREEFQIEMEVEIEKVTSRLLQEKQEELEKLRKELESENKAALEAKAKEVWLREQEDFWRQKIQTEVEKARADWLTEQSSSLQDTIDSAIHAAEVEWRTLQEVDKEREIKERITEVEERLLSERTASIELEVMSRLEEERKKWIELLETEKSDVCKERDTVNEWLDEKSRLCEENSKLQKDIDNLNTAHAKVEEDLKTDIERLKHELSDFESNSQNLQQEKKALQETLRKEFSDMQEEMNKLLAEKSKLQDSTLAELDKLRLENVRLQEDKEKLMVEAKAELEAKVKMVVKEAEEKFRQELDKTVSMNKDRQQISESVIQERVEKQVSEALEKAQKSWQTEEDVNRARAVYEAQEGVRAELEARYKAEIAVIAEESSKWQAEVNRLRAEMSSQVERWSAERETILRENDAERKRCMEEIQAQCEQDIKQFMENHQHTLTSALKSARQQQTAEKQRFEQEIKELKTREQQLLGSLRSTPNTSENSEGRALSEGETTPGSLSTSCGNCEQLEKELKSFKDIDNLDQMREEKEQVKEKLTKYNTQVKKLLQDRQKLQVSLQNLQQRRQLEEQHLKLKEKQATSGDDSNASDQSEPRLRVEEQLNAQLQKTEALVRELEEKRVAELKELRSSLEAEHSAAMETMRKKIVDLRKTHSTELDKVRRKFSDEKQELTGKIEKLKSRCLTSTPVQTETSEAEKSAILEVRAHYIDAVAKIREDVMKHVTETNLRAAEKIKKELARGRSSLVLEVKTTCLQVIRNVLDKSRLGTNTTSITNAIEKQLEITSVQIAGGKMKTEEQGSASSAAVKLTVSREPWSAKETQTFSRRLSQKSSERSRSDHATDERAVSNRAVFKEKISTSKSGVNEKSRKDIGRTKECDVSGIRKTLQNGHSYERNAIKDVGQQKNLKFVGYVDDKLAGSPVQDCDTSVQTDCSEAHLPSNGGSLNISDSMYLPLVADSTKNATVFQAEEEELRFHSLPANPDGLLSAKPSRDVKVTGALQKLNGSSQGYRRQNDSPAGEVYRTRSSSPRPRQREERPYLSATRESRHGTLGKDTSVFGLIEDRTANLPSRTSGLVLAHTGHKSVGLSGAPGDSGIGTLGRERRNGSGMAGRRANTLSEPGTGGDMDRIAQRFDHHRPVLFRQSSENSLSSSFLTQYEDDSSGPSTYRSTVEEIAPLDFDTEGTLTSLGLGQRSPRKYNPVPEKDVPRRRLPAAEDNKEYSWRRSMEAYREANFANTRTQPAWDSVLASAPSAVKSSSTLSNFSSHTRKESCNEGRESNVSDTSDVSYNLRLSSTFDSSAHGAREQLGQSFIPNIDPPRLGGQGSVEAVRRPVPVMGRRIQDTKSAFSDPHKS